MCFLIIYFILFFREKLNGVAIDHFLSIKNGSVKHSPRPFLSKTVEKYCSGRMITSKTDIDKKDFGA